MGYSYSPTSAWLASSAIARMVVKTKAAVNSERDKLLVAQIFKTENSHQLEKIKELIVDQSIESNKKSILLAVITTLAGAILSYVVSFYIS